MRRLACQYLLATFLAWTTAAAAATALPLLPRAEALQIDVRPRPAPDGTVRLAIEVTFAAGGRTRTPLALPSEWAGATQLWRGVIGLQAVSRGAHLEDPTADAGRSGAAAPDSAGAEQRTVAHPPDGLVRLRYELAEYGNPHLGHRRFYQPLLRADYAFFFGHGAWVLPRFDDSQRLHLRLTVRDLPAGWRAASSFGASAVMATTAVWEVDDLLAGHLRHSVYALGDFRLHRVDIEGQPVWMALRGKFRFPDARFVERTAALVAAHRTFFADHSQPFLLLTLLPNDQEQGSAGGTAVFRAFAMHASAEFDVPGPQYDFLVAHEHLHGWMPGRFGTMSAAGAQDEALRYWFSEGFTNFLSHRLQVASGAWSLADYARTLNRVIERYELSEARGRDNQAVLARFFQDEPIGQLPYQRGELLALHWDAQLRARGTSLAAVLRRLMLPPGPYAERPPLATERLLAALAPHLGDAPRQDVARLIEQPGAFDYGADFAGPCFERQPAEFARWELGFDRARTFQARQVVGLVPGSAAQAAGLREGDTLAGFSVHFGDVEREVQLTVERDGKREEVRYLPRGRDTVAGVRYVPRAGAAADAGCSTWRALR